MAHGFGQAQDGGQILGTAPSASFLGAFHDRHPGQAGAHPEQRRAPRSSHLVSREHGRIRLRKINGDLAPRLRAVLDAHRAADRRHRVADARLVAGGHLDDRCGLGGSVPADPPHIVPLLQWIQAGAVFAGEDQGGLIAQGRAQAVDQQVQGFRGAGAKDQFSGLRAQAFGDDATRFLDAIPRPLAFAVDAGGIGPVCIHGARHRFDDGGQGRRRRVGIEVVALHALIVAAPGGWLGKLEAMICRRIKS